MADAIPDYVRDDLVALKIPLAETQLLQLSRYLDLLLEANERMNLTAVTERDVAWRRLILDSLTVLPMLDPSVKTLLDVGSGGGMPGIPMAIACPNVQVTLLDATGKKVAFHNDVIETLGLKNCRSIKARAEDLAHERAHRECYDVVVSRAVGVMSNVIEYSVPFLRVGGWCLAMKGPRITEELEQCHDALTTLGCEPPTITPAWPAVYGNELVIASIRKRSATRAEFPRPAGTPKTRPL